MCCCGKPTINGEPGYSWDGKGRSVYPVSAPTVSDDETVIHDEPGRCGGLDSHSYHFTVVKERFGGYSLLVRHGGGEERIRLGSWPGVGFMAGLDSNARYWLLQTLYHVQEQAAREAQELELRKWRLAAAEKRIKTRKRRNSDMVDVWIQLGQKEFDGQPA